jgi:hypothetical protein
LGEDGSLGNEHPGVIDTNELRGPAPRHPQRSSTGSAGQALPRSWLQSESASAERRSSLLHSPFGANSLGGARTSGAQHAWRRPHARPHGPGHDQAYEGLRDYIGLRKRRPPAESSALAEAHERGLIRHHPVAGARVRLPDPRRDERPRALTEEELAAWIATAPGAAASPASVHRRERRQGRRGGRIALGRPRP